MCESFVMRRFFFPNRGPHVTDYVYRYVCIYIYVYTYMYTCLYVYIYTALSQKKYIYVCFVLRTHTHIHATEKYTQHAFMSPLGQ